mmetsp:Transcript_22654/g.40071  ORF Transcript_22654/g.40071 Transcript_22654/m.40071 type:complete len:90 (+) Transcript_22654:350-619(+)
MLASAMIFWTKISKSSFDLVAESSDAVSHSPLAPAAAGRLLSANLAPLQKIFLNIRLGSAVDLPLRAYSGKKKGVESRGGEELLFLSSR